MNEVLAEKLAKESKSKLNGKNMLYKDKEKVINSENQIDLNDGYEFGQMIFETDSI